MPTNSGNRPFAQFVVRTTNKDHISGVKNLKSHNGTSTSEHEKDDAELKRHFISFDYYYYILLTRTFAIN